MGVTLFKTLANEIVSNLSLPYSLTQPMTATYVAILSFIRSAFLKALFIQARPLQLLDGSHSTNVVDARKVTDLYLMEEDPISSVFVALKCLEHSFCTVMVDVPYLKAKT